MTCRLKWLIVIIEEKKGKRFCGLCEAQGQKRYYKCGTSSCTTSQNRQFKKDTDSDPLRSLHVPQERKDLNQNDYTNSSACVVKICRGFHWVSSQWVAHSVSTAWFLTRPSGCMSKTQMAKSHPTFNPPKITKTFWGALQKHCSHGNSITIASSPGIISLWLYISPGQH